MTPPPHTCRASLCLLIALGTVSHCVIQAGLELATVQPQPPERRDQRPESLRAASPSEEGGVSEATTPGAPVTPYP